MQMSFKNAFLSLAALLAATASLHAQVVLDPSPTPSSATVGNSVTLKGTSFPAGTLPTANMSLTITPPSGNGAPVTIHPANILASGAARLITFTIPSALVVNSPIVCSISVAGTTSGAVSYTTATASSMTINPSPTVSNISPGAGTRGTAVNVSIAGNFTTFQASSAITVGAPGGITVSNVHAVSTQLITATFMIDPAATPGSRDITVKTGTESAKIVAGFLVGASNGLSFNSISPSVGALGQTLNVTVTGANTHFDNSTFANFGDGITVNSISGITPTSLTANITIKTTTYLGIRMVTVVTGGEYATSGAQGFNVVASNATLSSISPNTASQATNLSVVVTGANTHFLQNASNLSISGVNVGNVTVTSPTSLTASIAVGPNTSVGAHDVNVTTGGEAVTLPGAFTVTSSTPFLSSVAPTSAMQGTAFSIGVTGVNTNFQQNNISVDFGSNITAGVTVNSPTSLTINGNVALVAAVGSRNVIIHSGGTDFNFSFSVTSGGATIISVAPTPGLQGSTPTITVTGANTHWVQGTTTATVNYGAYYLTVNRITVLSATSATLDLTIPAGFPVGGYSLVMSTGGENANGTYSVAANTPTLTITPSSGLIGTTVPVNFIGDFTHFVNGTTTLNIDGQGVTLTNFSVTSAASATAKLVIAGSAPLGVRTLTMTTGLEVVTTPFSVTSTPAVLTYITPNHSPVSSTLNIVISGAYTSFQQGVTTVGLGPNVTVNNVTVLSATSLRANITIGAAAAFGWRTAFVNTNTEQLTIGFRIDSPRHRPSSARIRLVASKARLCWA